MLDGYALIVAGLLLIVPGLLSDVVGLILLIPPVRRAGIRWAVSRLFVGAGTSGTTGDGNAARTIVIEGTFERLKDSPGESEKDV